LHLISAFNNNDHCPFLSLLALNYVAEYLILPFLTGFRPDRMGMSGLIGGQKEKVSVTCVG
jgi:hypothetical protein